MRQRRKSTGGHWLHMNTISRQLMRGGGGGEVDDVDGGHSKLVICDGHTADRILSRTHPVLQSCSAAWLKALMIDLDDTGLVSGYTHTPHQFKKKNNNSKNSNCGLDGRRRCEAD